MDPRAVSFILQGELAWHVERSWSVVLLVVPVVAGCLQPLTPTEPTVQPGDLVVADLTRHVENGSTDRFEQIHLVVAGDVPADDALPEGWTRNGTRTAVPGLVQAMEGMRAGETRDTGWLAPAKAHGRVDPAYVDRFDRQANLSRTVQAPVEDGMVEAYGRTWPATERDGSAYLEVDDADVGARLEVPGFWGNATRMWLSELVAFDASNLTVEHRVEAGDEVTRGGVEGRVTSVDGSGIVVDRNHPLAGHRVRFEVTVEEIVFVEPRPAQAPDFATRTLEGETFRLSDHRGEPVLIYFFATWCTVCKQQTPRIVDTVATAAGNVTALAVSIDPNESPSTVRDYRDRYVGSSGAEIRFAIDSLASRVGRTYQVVSIPKTVVVAPDGTLTFSESGTVATDRMIAALEG